MNKRECGTCRFFEQSGIGETGWCRNSRCKDIVGIALVRRQELACRIGWNDDSYEALANAAEPIPGETRTGADTMRQRSGFQGTRPDDIIVGIEQPRTVTEQETMPVSRSRMSNVGEAHRRALERRQIAQQSGDDYAPRRLESPARQTPDSPTREPITGEPARQQSLHGDEGVSAPRRIDPNMVPAAAPSPSANTMEIAIPQEPYDNRPVAPEPVSGWAPPQAPPYSAYPPPVTPQPPGYAAPQPEYLPQAPSPPQPTGFRSPLDAEWEAQERQRHRGKRCANCRHFQVAESGDRGWCRNRFAFPTPQLVGPNDLACLTGIGTWWAANDQWWLAKAGLPVQTVPTPYADALLAELQEEEKRRAALRRPNTG